MSDGTNGQPRSAQADELLAALRRNSIAVTALAAAVGALVIAVNANTAVLEELEMDEDHDPACDDDDCDGSCLDEPAPRRRVKRRG